MSGPPGAARSLAARSIPFILLVVVFVVLGVLSPRFLTVSNFRNILVQSSSVGIVAVGMTIVLLTGGIDLSVGSTMFLAAAVAGQLALGTLSPQLAPTPAWVAVAMIIPTGVIVGSVNALLIARLRLAPFVVTLATLYIARGYALGLTETRALNLPPSFLAIGQGTLAGIPFPVWFLAVVVAIGHVLLTQTPLGRQIYAYGDNPEAAKKAGIRTTGLLAAVYVLSGLCASLAGVVSVAQLGAVSPTFGFQREFAAIAAAVLGGTSLFGGRGSIFPGTLLGAVLIQSVENGLQTINADPYVYPVITGGVIFAAVLLDRVARRGAGR